MQVVVDNAKGHDTEPGCQAYFFFQPADGNEEFLYGVEMYLFDLRVSDLTVTTPKTISKTPISIPMPSKVSKRTFPSLFN